MASRCGRAAALLAVPAALAAPAAAAADTTSVAVNGTALEITGLPGAASAVEVRYRTADETGFNEVSDRFEIADEGGIQPIGADCATVSPTLVSCDASPVGSLTAAMGDGDDVVVVDATVADAVPGNLSVLLAGQGGADLLRGGLGDDRLRGGAGRDTLAGWSGDDDIEGGAGADGVLGFAGNDRLQGGAGRDALFGQKGRDRMFGGPQNDVLLARDGFRDPVINCGSGSRQTARTDARDPDPRGCTLPKERRKRKAAKKQVRTAERYAWSATALAQGL